MALLCGAALAASAQTFRHPWNPRSAVIGTHLSSLAGLGRTGISPLIRGYRFIRKLGASEHSSVYLAERESAGIEVVLKVLRQIPDASDSVGAFDRFLQEYELIAELKHPNIVRNKQKVAAAVTNARAFDVAFVQLEVRRPQNLDSFNVNQLLLGGVEILRRLEHAEIALDAGAIALLRYRAAVTVSGDRGIAGTSSTSRPASRSSPPR